MEGFQKPRRGNAKPVGMAIISNSGDFLACSCGGWVTRIVRKKTAEARAQRHLDRKHGGKGLWL